MAERHRTVGELLEAVAHSAMDDGDWQTALQAFAMAAEDARLRLELSARLALPADATRDGES